ncbi:MAG: hypothetical protein ACKVZ6_10380, partial [Kineosporiaceae bacterium]
MIPTASDGVARLVAAFVRRADAGLVHGATRNAAAGIADGRAQHLDELRTLRDLRALDGARPAAARPAPAP